MSRYLVLVFAFVALNVVFDTYLADVLPPFTVRRYAVLGILMTGIVLWVFANSHEDEEEDEEEDEDVDVEELERREAEEVENYRREVRDDQER